MSAGRYHARGFFWVAGLALALALPAVLRVTEVPLLGPREQEELRLRFDQYLVMATAVGILMGLCWLPVLRIIQPRPAEPGPAFVWRVRTLATVGMMFAFVGTLLVIVLDLGVFRELASQSGITPELLIPLLGTALTWSVAAWAAFAAAGTMMVLTRRLTRRWVGHSNYALWPYRWNAGD